MGTTDHSSPLDQAAGRNVRGKGTAGIKPWYDGNVEVPSMTHETILLHGHIIDSLLLPKVLDRILQNGGSFEIAHIRIGKTREEPSDARIIVHAESPERLAEIIAAVQAHGASVEKEADCQWQEAPTDGVFPDDFYVTTHLPTEVRVHGKWVPVKGIEMDLGIRLDRNDLAPHTVPMAEVCKGDRIIVGHEGVRVAPLERPAHLDVFGFMGAQVSSERPHGHLIAGIARRMQALRRSEARLLLAGGPAIIHGGGREPLAWLIEAGYFHVLFFGNALAAHDMEAHLYGTSLGLHLEGGSLAHHGHEHHLRTINRIRAVGSIEEAVRQGVITTGIMAACVRRGVKVVMAGTIRDDGPLPGVITDSVEAQAAMRAVIPGIGLALLVASTLHAVATGNLLPAAIPSVCVDVNPAVPTKLADR